jgi:methyltransferase family protein
VTTPNQKSLSCVVCQTPIDSTADHLLRKDGFDLVSCPACGMVMRTVLPSRAELDEIYEKTYFKSDPADLADGYADYLADAETHREAARRRLALLDRFSPTRGRLLDVGAAAGFFVSEAIEQGWEAEGVDIAQHMVEWGRRHLGVPIGVAGIMAVPGRNAFAGVTMWDYIEHSIDPAAEIERANELLVEGGLLAISTGDMGSMAARACGSRWHLLTPRHHNFFFDERTLSQLLDRAGFEVEWRGHPGSRYSLAHLGYKLDRGARLRVTRALSRRLEASRLGRFSFPLNLFDIMTVIARKR